MGRLDGIGVDHQQPRIDEVLRHPGHPGLLVGFGILQLDPGNPAPGQSRAVLGDHAQEHTLDGGLKLRRTGIKQRAGTSMQRADNAADRLVVLAREGPVVGTRGAPPQLGTAIHFGQCERQHRQGPGHGHHLVDQLTDQRLRLEVQGLQYRWPLDALAEFLAAEGRHDKPRIGPEIGQRRRAGGLRLEVRTQRQHHCDGSIKQLSNLEQITFTQLRVPALGVQLLELIDEQQLVAYGGIQFAKDPAQAPARVAFQTIRVDHRPWAGLVTRRGTGLLRLLEPGQHPSLDHAGLAGPGSTDHRHQARSVAVDHALDDFCDAGFAAEEQPLIVGRVRPQTQPGIVGLIQRRIGKGVLRQAGIAENVFAGVVRPKRPDARCLQRHPVSAGEFLERELEQLGGGNHAIGRVLPTRRVGLAGQSPQ